MKILKFQSFNESLQNPEIWTPKEQQILQDFLDKNKLKDQYDQSNSALIDACEKGHLEIVKLLLKDPNVDPSGRDDSAIWWASKNGDTEIVKMLLNDHRVDPTGDDNYIIKWASYYGHLDIVKELLKYPEVDPTADDNYSIRMAEQNGHTEIVDLLKSVQGMPPHLRAKFFSDDQETRDTIQNFSDFGMFDN